MQFSFSRGFPGGLDGGESACNAWDSVLVPGLGRSPGEENDYPLQYSRLENSMARGAWWATVYGVTKSWTWLSNFHTQFYLMLSISIGLFLYSCAVRSLKKKNFHYMILLHFSLHNVITGPNTSCALSKYLVMVSLRKKTLKITKPSLDDTNSQYAFNYYIPWSPF